MMQHFKSSTGAVFAFEDDVIVTQTQGVYTFSDPSGNLLEAPSDLKPYVPELEPAPTENQKIVAQIAALEATVTPRRMREAALGTDGGWLKALDDQIVLLRAKLTK